MFGLDGNWVPIMAAEHHYRSRMTAGASCSHRCRVYGIEGIGKDEMGSVIADCVHEESIGSSCFARLHVMALKCRLVNATAPMHHDMSLNV